LSRRSTPTHASNCCRCLHHVAHPPLGASNPSRPSLAQWHHIRPHPTPLHAPHPAPHHHLTLCPHPPRLSRPRMKSP
jgi:hypothetical protein